MRRQLSMAWLFLAIAPVPVVEIAPSAEHCIIERIVDGDTFY
jgi:hypothetical protein